MKLSNRIRVFWWISLLLGLTFLLSQRYTAFQKGETTILDALAFIIWIALLLVPLFQEISLFGVSLKGEIKELKQDLKADVDDLKTELKNSIALNTNINPTIHLASAPPPDSQLPELENQIKDALESFMQDRGISIEASPNRISELDQDTLFLFESRYNVEVEVRRIFLENNYNFDSKMRHFSVSRMTKLLADEKVVDVRIFDAVRKLSSVTAPAIHGETPTQAQVSFVRDVTPELLATLRAI